MHASEKRGVAQDRMRQAFLSMDRRENASMSSCSVRDSFTQPPWQSSDLGIPIPDSAHAVSVAMPTWDSVVGYEEDDAKVMRALQCGYPRFFCHPRSRPCLMRQPGDLPERVKPRWSLVARRPVNDVETSSA